ncbi:hypothetical protein T492DRAFT_1111673 [Pavlovales sp. CCMP2436]|nr:hypothetical protein T492DRAFT_1111673 [Pavlovales sp. CCMP2436]
MRFGRDCRVLEHDLLVWFGDLNYRVALPNEQARKKMVMNEKLNNESYRNENNISQQHLQSGATKQTGDIFF